MKHKRFTELRDYYLTLPHFNRKLATLAARLHLGIDTLATIEKCVNFSGRPLLGMTEEAIILAELP